VQNGNLYVWFLGVVSVVRPSIELLRFWMTVQFEYFNRPIPDSSAVMRLGYRHAFDVFSLYAVQFKNYISQSQYVISPRHAGGSTRPPTLQKFRSNGLKANVKRGL